MIRRIAFDPRLRRPACPQIQATMGGSTEFADRFPTESWLTRTTKNMELIEVTEQMVDWLVDITKNRLRDGWFRSIQWEIRMAQGRGESGHVPRRPTMDEQEARMGSVSRNRSSKSMNWESNESQRRIDLRGSKRR